MDYSDVQKRDIDAAEQRQKRYEAEQDRYYEDALASRQRYRKYAEEQMREQKSGQKNSES